MIKYKIDFWISGDLTVQDVLEELEKYGNIVELIIHTWPGTSILKNEYSVIFEMESEE